MNDGSQYQEATEILNHFNGRVGHFLDVGAFDGISFSNTWKLAELGWSGVCVEPSPPAFCALMRNYAGNERIKLVNAALVAGPGTSRLRKLHCNTADSVSADMLSTLDATLRDRWNAHGFPFRDIWVSAIGWNDLYKSDLPEILTGSVDFANIDTEGTNLEVFLSMPLTPEMVCVEADPPEKIHDAVKQRYPHTEVIGGNVLGWK